MIIDLHSNSVSVNISSSNPISIYINMIMHTSLDYYYSLYNYTTYIYMHNTTYVLTSYTATCPLVLVHTTDSSPWPRDMPSTGAPEEPLKGSTSPSLAILYTMIMVPRGPRVTGGR